MDTPLQDDPEYRQLVADLRALDALPLTSKAEVVCWYSAADGFRARLHTKYAHLHDRLPHEIEHYLADADIRARDPAYATYQRKKLSVLLV